MNAIRYQGHCSSNRENHFTVNSMCWEKKEDKIMNGRMIFPNFLTNMHAHVSIKVSWMQIFLRIQYSWEQLNKKCPCQKYIFIKREEVQREAENEKNCGKVLRSSSSYFFYMYCWTRNFRTHLSFFRTTFFTVALKGEIKERRTFSLNVNEPDMDMIIYFYFHLPTVPWQV